MALLQPGDVVAVDAVTYPGFIVLARTLGLELSPLPVTEAGPDLDALEQLCRRRRVRAIYAMPTLHNPLGWVYDDSQRTQLVSIANRHGAFDHRGCLVRLPRRGRTTTAGHARPRPHRLCVRPVEKRRDRPAVRLHRRTPALVPTLERVIRATTWHTPGLTAAIACRWLEDGTVDRLETQKRNDARLRQSIASEVLAGLPCIGHPSSYFLWLPLAQDARPDRIAGSSGSTDGRGLHRRTIRNHAHSAARPATGTRLGQHSRPPSSPAHSPGQEADRDPFRSTRLTEQEPAGAGCSGRLWRGTRSTGGSLDHLSYCRRPRHRDQVRRIGDLDLGRAGPSGHEPLGGRGDRLVNGRNHRVLRKGRRGGLLDRLAERRSRNRPLRRDEDSNLRAGMSAARIGPALSGFSARSTPPG